MLTLAGVWDRSVLTEFEEEQWDPVFVSVPDKRRFLDSGELDICGRRDSPLEPSRSRKKSAFTHAHTHSFRAILFQIRNTCEDSTKLIKHKSK